jgi:hypothetical protein
MSYEIPDDLHEQVELARKIGVNLYLQDKASAIGTDVMLAHLSPAERSALRGYLTIREEAEGSPTDAWLVFFFTTDSNLPRFAFRARVPMQPGSRPTFAAVDPLTPTPGSAQVLIQARNTALAALSEYPQPLNPVVLPGSVIGHDGVLVYLLAGTTRSGVAVLGRHWRVLVSPDGSRVAKLEPLSKGIIEIPLEATGQPGTELVALTVTHLVTEHPLETHVFASLLYKRLIYVGTSRGDWRVEGDKISLIRTREPAPLPGAMGEDPTSQTNGQEAVTEGLVSGVGETQRPAYSVEHPCPCGSGAPFSACHGREHG